MAAIVVDVRMQALAVTFCAPDQSQLEMGAYERGSPQRLPLTDRQGLPAGDNVRFSLAISHSQIGPLTNRMEVNWGEQIALVCYDVDNGVPESGKMIRLTLHWRPLSTVGANHSLLVRMLSENGRTAMQVDGWPRHCAASADWWQPSTTIDHVGGLTPPVNALMRAYPIEPQWQLIGTDPALPVLQADSQGRTTSCSPVFACGGSIGPE